MRQTTDKQPRPPAQVDSEEEWEEEEEPGESLSDDEDDGEDEEVRLCGGFSLRRAAATRVPWCTLEHPGAPTESRAACLVACRASWCARCGFGLDALTPGRGICALCARVLLSTYRCACTQAAAEDDYFLVPDDDAGDADGPKATAGLTLGTAAARILKEPLIVGQDCAHPRPQRSRDRRAHSFTRTHTPTHARTHMHRHALAELERSQVRAGFRIGRRRTRPSRCACACNRTLRAP